VSEREAMFQMFVRRGDDCHLLAIEFDLLRPGLQRNSGVIKVGKVHSAARLDQFDIERASAVFCKERLLPRICI
jgi:hypothetical protein